MGEVRLDDSKFGIIRRSADVGTSRHPSTVKIFGVPAARGNAKLQIASPLPVPPAAPSSHHLITGTLLAVNGATLTLQTRTGTSVKIDASQAAKNQQMGYLVDSDAKCNTWGARAHQGKIGFSPSSPPPSAAFRRCEGGSEERKIE
jgi:hypothetical protein